MKIAILTYHKTTNYGAIFQAYALQKKLNNMNVEAEILDYRNDTLTKRYSINPFVDMNFKNIIKRTLSLKNKIILQSKFEKFSLNNISTSKKIYNENNIVGAGALYDKFIVGSDQVWNLKLSGNDYNYFLDFLSDNTKKYSYAASFGITAFSDDEKKLIRQYLDNFAKISIREADGIKLAKEMGICDTYQNVDPVFFLNAKEWNSLIPNKESNLGKYILVYEITYTPNLINFSKKYAREKNLKVVFISGSNRKIRGFINKNNLSPEEFLMYLKNATYVITSSFHGVALSIVLEKEFYFDLPSSKKSTGSRITSLVNLLKIENRNISSEHIDSKKIDYGEVEKILKEEIKKSEKYLLDILVK